MSPQILLDTPFKEIRIANQFYLSAKQRISSAEKAKFRSAMQGERESEGNYLSRLRE